MAKKPQTSVSSPFDWGGLKCFEVAHNQFAIKCCRNDTKPDRNNPQISNKESLVRNGLLSCHEEEMNDLEANASINQKATLHQMSPKSPALKAVPIQCCH